MHIAYCTRFDISIADLQRTKESIGRNARRFSCSELNHTACVAYSRYILDVGHSQDLLGLYMALAPCLLGYQAAAQFLGSDSNSVKQGNPYWTWVENYTSQEYSEAVRKGSGTVKSAEESSH